jgi:pyridoxal phosphate enzyme (YggS family)
VNEKIEKAAYKSGRRPEDVTLVAVTKTVDPIRINELLSLGVRDIGENKVQELTGKYDEIKYGPNLHMIGHLQTNKVKYIIDKVSMIQSVDSEKVAAEISKRAEKAGKTVDILVEVNIGNEDSKYGIEQNSAFEFIEQLYNLTNICISGLMCVAPYVIKPEHDRDYFKKMYKLYIDIKNKVLHNNSSFRFLSMGMSNDYEVAIEEGSNMIRVGTALFGERL